MSILLFGTKEYNGHCYGCHWMELLVYGGDEMDIYTWGVEKGRVHECKYVTHSLIQNVGPSQTACCHVSFDTNMNSFIVF